MHHLNEILALLGGGVLFFITTLLIYRQGWIPSGIPGRSHCVLLAVLAAGCLFSFLGLMLLFLGWFTRPAILLGWVVVMVPIVLFKCAADKPDAEESSGLTASKVPVWVPILLLVIGLFVTLRPDENLFGNWDPGVYLAQSTAIATHGTYYFPDTLSELLTDEERQIFYPVKGGRQVKMPGFFVSQNRAHHLEPQFFPLYPLQVAFVQLFGNLQASLYVSSLGAWLSLVFVYLIGARLAGGWGGVLALFLFLVQPVQIWFASFHTAELHLQAMFLAGFWCWLLWREHRTGAAAFMAGALFSLLLFTSVTGLALAGLYAGMHLLFVWKERSGLYFYLPLIPAGILSLVQIRLFTPQYFESVMAYVPLLQRMALWIIPVVFLAVIGFCIAQKRVGSIHYKRLLHTFGVAGLLLAGALILMARGHRSVLPVELLGGIGMLAAALGGWLLLLRRPADGMALVLPALLFTALFTFHPLMSANYPWTFKRLIPVTLPVACLLMGFVGTWLMEQKSWGRWRFGVLALLMLLATVPLYQHRAQAFHRDWMGSRIFTRAVAQDLPDDAVVIARKWLATPLEIIHGKQVLPLYDGGPEEADYRRFVQRMLASGHAIYVVHQTKRPILPGCEIEPVALHRVDASILEQSRRPGKNRIKPRKLRVRVSRVVGL